MGALFLAAVLMMTCPQRAAAQDYDPPGRVARLSYLQGSVSFQPAGESDWGPAVVNRPITTGDRLWADNGSRAEMQLGSATVRLGARTGMSFFNLDDQTTQIELSEGTLSVSVLRLDRDEYFEVDTPNQAFSILRAGQYRVQVSEDGSSSQVTVRAGNGEVTGGGRTYSVGAGLTGDFTGTDSLRADIYRSGGNDEFDSWSQDRDRRYDASPSARYVSRDVVGYQDLDDYGSWRPDSNYGNVWMPRVAGGWAPYHDGHWAWISPWGWTWVDDAPWGYAPFHYGRWVYVGNNWGWVPGPIAVRPVYAPALVVFFGGPRFGVSVSVGGGGGYGGNVGWFPLGPREVYVPAYQTSRAYVDRVNITNTTVNNTTITNVYNNTNNTNITYANRNVRGGVTAVSQSTFTSAQPVGRAAVAVNQQEIASAPISRRAEVAPTRNSVFGTSAPTGNRVPQPPAAVVNRSVVAKKAPPPTPVSFERQQQKLAAQPGQPLARNEVDGLRPANGPAQQPRVRQAPPGRPAAADSNQPGNQPGNARPSNPPAADVAPNPPPNNAPGRGNRPNGANRNQTDNAQPSNQPAADTVANPPASNAPPARSDRPNGPNRSQPANVQPAAPPAAVAPTPPANDAPLGRGNRPNGANRNQPANVQPAAPPAAVAPTPPANDAPLGRGNRPNGANRGGQPANVQPAAPPAAVAPTPPASNAPPARSDRPNGPNRDQPANVQPAAPPVAVAPTPPASNAPPVRSDRPNGGNRGGQPDNAQPPTPPAANVAPNPPANNAPPGRGNRPNGGNRGGQTDNAQPATPPAADVAPNPPVNNALQGVVIGLMEAIAAASQTTRSRRLHRPQT